MDLPGERRRLRAWTAKSLEGKVMKLDKCQKLINKLKHYDSKPIPADQILGDEANLNLSEYCEEMVSYLVKNRKNEAVSFGLHLELAVRLARQYPECQEQLIAQLEKSADLDNRLLLGELTIILELPAKHLHGVMARALDCGDQVEANVEFFIRVIRQFSS